MPKFQHILIFSTESFDYPNPCDVLVIRSGDLGIDFSNLAELNDDLFLELTGDYYQDWYDRNYDQP